MTIGIETNLVQLAMKVTLVLAAGWLVQFLLSKRNPRWTVLSWRVTAVSLVVLFISGMRPPVYGIPLLPASIQTVDDALDDSVPLEQPIDAESMLTVMDRRTTQLGSPGTEFNPTAQPDTRVAEEPAAIRVDAIRLQKLETLSPISKTSVVQITATNDSLLRDADWWVWVRSVYWLVAGALIARLVTGFEMARRACSIATPAPQWVQEIADRLTKNPRLSAVRFRITNRFASPVLCGIWRRTILIPESMLHSTSTETDIRGAIAHEAAHAAGHDLFWDLVVAAVTAFVWPNPLAWRARAAHRAACERVSDRSAVDAVGDLSVYQSLVARIALDVSKRHCDVGVAMARTSEVRQRLATLANCPGVPRLGRKATIVASTAIGVAFLLSVGSLARRSTELHAAEAEKATADTGADPSDNDGSPKKSNDAPARIRPESLTFKVVQSDDGSPIQDAKITVQLYSPKLSVRPELKTDSDGVAKFEYPDGDEALYVWARVQRSGFVPAYVNFGQNLIPAALPTTKTFRMDRGKTIGGKVVDEQGNPIAGAAVSIWARATDSPFGNAYDLFDQPTNEDGTWLFDGAPISLDGMNVGIKHPRFLQSSQPIQDKTDGQYVLMPGLKLTGRVADQSGKPIPAAHLTVGRDRWGAVNNPTRVDQDGRFTIYALPAQSTWITAEAPGFAPQIHEIEVAPNTEPIEFKLEPGLVTRFKIVNSEGEPIQGIGIHADTWKGFRPLWWQGKTDANGWAVWNGAPPEPVQFDIGAEGYAYLRKIVAEPREEPYLLTLHRTLVVTGTVTGSQQELVPEFQVGFGHKIPDRDEISWDQNRKSSGRNGKFEIRENEACDEIYVRVEANGFKPWISDAIRFDKGEQKLFVKLLSGGQLAGTVRSPNGEPARGAQLTLLTAKNSMQFTSGYKPRGGKQTVHADDEGHFELSQPDEESLIAAVHDSGYAEVTGEAVLNAGGIRLRPWATVEVVVRRGDAPLPGATVRIVPFDVSRKTVRVSSFDLQGLTNADGRVVFERVVPGTAHVKKVLIQELADSRANYPERSTKVSLEPGERMRIEFGGSGAALKGRFVVTGEPPPVHQWKLNDALLISTLPEPGNEETIQHYYCLIEDDGSFLCHDIPPGRYRLDLVLKAVHSNLRMGMITRDIEVKGDVPVVDLGTIEGSYFKRLGVGQQAPPFAAEWINCDPIRMADLAGRLVVIDFWATWSGPCLADMPKFAQLHQEFAADPRVELIALSIDRSIDDPASIIKKNNWAWKSGFVGPGLGGLVPKRFELDAVPTRFLIDVDGKFLYRGKELNEIAKLMRERLKQLPAVVDTHNRPPMGVQPIQVEDSFPAGRPIALAMIFNNTTYNAGKASLNGPGVALWSSDGHLIRAFEDIGGSGWLTGPQRMAMDPQRERIYVCDTFRRRLVAINHFGRRLFDCEMPQLHSAAVDEKTGDVWCLTTSQLNSGEILVVDENGREKNRLPIGAYGIAFSPVEDAFWIVGNSISKLTRDGKQIANHPLPKGGYTFTEIAVNREHGGGWVLEDNHPDAPLSQLRLWKFSPDGSATPVHRFTEKIWPCSVACINGAPWVTMTKMTAPETPENEVRRFDSDGKQSTTLDLQGSCLAVGMKSGTIWLRTNDGISQIDPDGKPLTTIPAKADNKTVCIIAF